MASGIGRGTHYKLNESYLQTYANAKPKDKVKDKVKDKPLSESGRNKTMVIKELTQFCQVWKKSSEMARYVGKTPTYLSRSIIPEMIERGLLIREYPDNPHHPAQRYRTKPNGESI